MVQVQMRELLEAGVHFGQSTDPLRVTAYIAWILADTNRNPAALQKALEFVRGSQRWPERFKSITPDYNAYMMASDLADPPDIDAHREDYELVCWHEGMREQPQFKDGSISGYDYGADWEDSKKITITVE